MNLATVSSRGLRILDFDMECRPLAWYGGDFVTKQPTVIACKVVGSKSRPKVWAVGESGIISKILDEEREMMESFIREYNRADVVTGHYIRGFDLPLANGALMRLGLPPLEPKLAQDTKGDLLKRGGLSVSQENLGAMFELNHPKVKMNTAMWAEANMLLTKGIREGKARCIGDVEQHIELRAAMLERKLLRAPSMWSPKSNGSTPQYTP